MQITNIGTATTPATTKMVIPVSHPRASRCRELLNGRLTVWIVLAHISLSRKVVTCRTVVGPQSSLPVEAKSFGQDSALGFQMQIADRDK